MNTASVISVMRTSCPAPPDCTHALIAEEAGSCNEDRKRVNQSPPIESSLNAIEGHAAGDVFHSISFPTAMTLSSISG